MKGSFITSGTCSRKIDYEIENGRIVSVTFHGGCPGNLEGISRLLVGADVQETIEKLKGIRCGFKSTSCPDQLARALEAAINQ